MDRVSRLASMGAIGFSVAIPLVVLVAFLVPPTLHFLEALAATAVYLPLHVRHVRYGLRGVRPRGLPWTLLAMGVAIVAATPLLGAWWLYSFHALAASLLVTTRPRVSFPAVAATLVVVGVWGGHLAATVGADQGVYLTAAVLDRAMTVFVLVWLVGALRRIRSARRALADQALEAERRRVDAEFGGTVGAQLESVVSQGQNALQTIQGGARGAKEELESLVEGSRRVLADARRLAGRYNPVSPIAELEKAASLLRAAGMEVRVEVPDAALPQALDEHVRASLRGAVAHLLQEGATDVIVLKLARENGDYTLESPAAGERDDGVDARADQRRLQARGASGSDDRAGGGSRRAFSSPSVDLWWSTRRSRILLAAVHVPFLLVAPLITASGLEDRSQNPWLVAPLAIAVAALQLRHSFAAARGTRPTWWPVTLTLLGLLVFVPLPWFKYEWGSTTWFFIASAAMLLTERRLRLLLTVGPVIGIALWTSLSDPAGIASSLYDVVFWTVSLSGSAVCLFGAARLVRAADELFATRAELAESTVGRERMRLSRDLHDLLGQSLSAVSLKGDLALSLLRGGSRSAAEEEIRSLIEVAREALHDIRHVVRDRHPVSLDTETRGAGVLLAAASIDAKIEVAVRHLSRPVDELLGWATREGVTNMLRHSQASSCTIRAARQNGAVVLEITNDGASPASSGGSGISGLSERAQALAGSVTAGHVGDGRFRLIVEVPETEAIA